MRLSDATIAITYALLATNGAAAYSLSHLSGSSRASLSNFGTDLRHHHMITKTFKSVTDGTRATTALNVAVEDETRDTILSETSSPSDAVPLSPVEYDYETINKLTFRELQKECKERGLAAVGITAALRSTLLEHIGIISPLSADDAQVDECTPDGIEFCDESDPTYDFNLLLSEINDKASVGHWKAATRKLKKLARRYNNSVDDDGPTIPRETYISVLKTCLTDRLHGARAAEPARKILEEMSKLHYVIPPELGNACVVSCLSGRSSSGAHEGFGGIDTALAMLAALESTEETSKTIASDTYGAVVMALSSDGAAEEAILLTRAMVVEHSFTPEIEVFAALAASAAKDGDKGEIVFHAMTLAKAAGYVLDDIASTKPGRDLLASGVIAAEQTDNTPLGLRLLTAAAKAEGCEPDGGDALVASSSKAAQRASTLIHRRAINTAVMNNDWQLAVRLLQLMPKRSLTPSAWVWRKVVTCCCKNEKSRKATGLLLDWVKLSEELKADPPPLRIFNNVVNTCEICGEEELTLLAFEAMKATHDTGGNTITFNIALKRLAKQGQIDACEGIIIGMLEEGIEPNVVTYTTAVGACVKAMNSKMAYEWLKRMRSRNVGPNFHTYNTALASCLDGSLEGSQRGSLIAAEMMTDVQNELMEGLKGPTDYASVIPDKYTKVLARKIIKQLRENWRAGQIDMPTAKLNERVSLKALVDFDRSESAEKIQKQRDAMEQLKKAITADSEGSAVVELDKSEVEVDFTAVNMLHKDSHRTMEV